MKLSEAKERREQIIERELAINAQLSEMKRAYIVEKVPGDFAARTTLEAELAQLAVEKHALTRALNDSKNAVKAYRNTLSHAILIKLLNDRGLSDIVIEADRLAVDAALVEA